VEKQADAAWWLLLISHFTTMLHITERTEGSMERQYQIGNGYLGHSNGALMGFPGAAGCTQGGALLIARRNNPDLPRNLSLPKSIVHKQPLQTIRASDQEQYLAISTSFLPLFLRQ